MVDLLWIEVQNGNEKAFERCFRSFYTPLCAYAKRWLADEDQSKELVQELFLYLWENRNSININQSLKGYLIQSVRNRSLNYLKKRQTKYKNEVSGLELYEDIIGEEIFDVLVDKELQETFRNHLNQLPEKCRQIFLMNREEGLSYRQIAVRLSISERTVETQMRRALKKLTVEMGDLFLIVLLLIK